MANPLNFHDAVHVVTDTFAVVVGFAITCFLEKSRMARNYNKNCTIRRLRLIFFCSVVTVVVSVALRFLIGSTVHLLYTYVRVQLYSADFINPFVKDIAFLIIFGVFFVNISLAKDFFQFSRRLTWFFVVVVGWSVLTRMFSKYLAVDQDVSFARFWFPLDLVQLSITLAAAGLFWLSRKLGHGAGLFPCAVMLLLAISYASIFVYDLNWLINKDSERPEQHSLVWFPVMPRDASASAILSVVSRVTLSPRRS